MLTRLELEHFKCFSLLKLPLGRLTLLTGANASGKSSILQSLVLLHQTIREQEWSTRLLLNGRDLSLGTVTDLVDKVTGRKAFSISLLDDDHNGIKWVFEGTERRDMSAVVSSVTCGDKTVPAPETLRFLLPTDAAAEFTSIARRLMGICFLTAERVGPRDFYPLEDPNSSQLVGPRGEYAPSVFHWRRDSAVLDGLVLPGRAPTLLHQVEGWMNEFFPGCSIEIQEVAQSNGVVLGLRTSLSTSFHRPIHVGFGLTQVFPIIVAALSRGLNELLLIENPEVHLHPAGQAKMGAFLCKVAAAGIQVLIETHSDHVLNGIRRSVKSATIDSHDVYTHFIRDRDTEGDQVISPVIDPSGNIDVWPGGFFDQFDKDMNHFAGWGE